MTVGGTGPLVIDTHTALWFLQRDLRLSALARAAIVDALGTGHPIYVPSISLVELVYLVEKGRIPAEVAGLVDRVLRDPASGFLLSPLDGHVAEATRQVSRNGVPDLPD